MAAGFNIRNIVKSVSRAITNVSVTRAVLFVVPSLAITLVSCLLFALLKGFPAQQLNEFAIILMSAVILSLMGTAIIQVCIYRIVDEAEHAKDEAANRGIRLGIVYGLVFSIVVSGVLYPYFHYALHLSLVYFLHFAVLLTLFSIIWAYTAAFWATVKYKYPAVIFTFSCLAILSLSYGFYQIDPGVTISGYTLGIAILLLLSLVASRSAFGKTPKSPKAPAEHSAITRLVSQNRSVILFQALYMLALFLDKIIVWVSEGASSESGLMIIGPYTVGAFIGLIPMFGIAALAYFTNKVKPVVEDMFQGTLSDIRRKTERYRHFYWRGLRGMLIAGFVLFMLVGALSFFLMNDPQVFRVAITISLGSLFFIMIIYNSVVSPMFRKTNISVVSMLVVCICESIAIFFVPYDVWYASIGFLVGSFIGFLISHFSVSRLLSEFEYNVFRPLTTAI